MDKMLQVFRSYVKLDRKTEIREITEFKYIFH